MMSHVLPSSEPFETLKGLEKLLAVVSRLRDPKTGCPWDLKQTHMSLKPYLLEESYEVLEAIDGDNESPQPDSLKEELGDVLLQVALHAQIAQEAKRFDFTDIAEGIAEKLIRRHPHVFGDVKVQDADEVTRNWNAIKAREKSDQVSLSPERTTKQASILSEVPKNVPALTRGSNLSKRAVKAGFKWPHAESLWACVMSEFDEFKAETLTSPKDPKRQHRLEDEMGDIFFASISLAHHYKVDPETALIKANAKFTHRFQSMEAMAQKPLEDLSFEEWDALWKQAKNQLCQ